MGIHNSSELSTERRVVDHPFKSNMKAFMTACAVLASSANADSQVFPNVVNHHPSMVSPYNVVPLNQGAYANVVSYDMSQPLTPVTRLLTTYGMAPVTTYGMGPTFGAHFVKREAESAYIIQTRMDNPMAGSEQEVQIKVDELGNGKSFQHVEQTDERNVMRDNYMLEYRRKAKRPFRPSFGQRKKVMDKRQKVADILGSLNNGDSETISKLEKVIQDAQGLWEMAYDGLHAKAENLKEVKANHNEMAENLKEAKANHNEMTQNLKEAKANHNEMTKNLKKTFGYHNVLGKNLKEAIKLIKSAKEDNIRPKYRPSNFGTGGHSGHDYNDYHDYYDDYYYDY